MYVSDYGFTASPSAWTTTLNYYGGNDINGNKITEENWMYMGLLEWTMARYSYQYQISGYVYYSGYVDFDRLGIFFGVINQYALGVRPVFHLKSQVEVIEGDETKNNPLKIRLGN